MSKLYAKSTRTERSADLPSPAIPNVATRLNGWVQLLELTFSPLSPTPPPTPDGSARWPELGQRVFPKPSCSQIPPPPILPLFTDSFSSTVPRASECFPPVSQWPLPFSLPSETSFPGLQPPLPRWWLSHLAPTFASLSKLQTDVSLSANRFHSPVPQSPHTWNQTHTSYTTEPPKALEQGTQVTLESREVGLNTEHRLRNLSRKKSAPSSIPRRGNYPPQPSKNLEVYSTGNWRQINTHTHTHTYI